MKNQLLKSVSFKYGLILASINLVSALAFFLFASGNSSLNNLSELALGAVFGGAILGVILNFFAFTICTVIAHYEYNKKNNHFISFTDAFVIGIIIKGIGSLAFFALFYLSAFLFGKGELQVLDIASSIGTYLLSVAGSILSSMFVLLFIITLESIWKVYSKAGKSGWAAFVPIYNTIVLLEIIKKPIWWFFLLLIPGVNLIVAIWMTNLLAKSFGKDEGFTVGLILLPIIFYPLLGMSDAKYLYEEEETQFYYPDILDA